jgi:L-serine dehydratase
MRALVGGLIGIAPDDLALRNAFDRAREAGLQWEFEETFLGDDAHPNSVVFEIRRAGDQVRVRGASVGGGRIEINGTIAAISSLCARHGVNLATMRVDRIGRHKDALMTIEADEPFPDEILAELRAFGWLRWARRIAKVD